MELLAGAFSEPVGLMGANRLTVNPKGITSLEA